MIIKGGCLCGSIRFTITENASGARYCWCRDCQRIASGSPTVNALFSEKSVEYNGELTKMELTADSGNIVERGFCPKCGSQMYSRTISGPEIPMRVRAGTLDDPEIVTPSAIIWGDSAPDWAYFTPGLPVYAKGPDSKISSKKRV